MIKDFFEFVLLAALSIFILVFGIALVAALPVMVYKACELLFNLLW